MIVTRQRYLKWQNQLHKNFLFKRWWQFWSNYSVFFYAVVAVILASHPNALAILILSALAFAFSRIIIIFVFNKLYYKPRPYQKYNFEPITSKLLSSKTDSQNSFPSRHATAFASVAAVVLQFSPTAGVVLLIVTVMTGIGRTILGFHFPSDITGGIILGMTLGTLIARVVPGLLFT